MKTVILAGGLGTRLSEETTLKPKPMVEIGGRPILHHIMAMYGQHGFNEFVVALGYMGEVVKQYFLDYRKLSRDLTIETGTGSVHVHEDASDNWTIHLVNTGLHTQTGGRLRRLKRWLGDATFMMSYGDGVADVDIGALVAFHRAHGLPATLTAVRPPARFGGLELEGDRVVRFAEKTRPGADWVSGGFFVLEPAVLDLIAGDDTVWEREPLEQLSRSGQLAVFRHDGFWQPMDTLAEKRLLEKLCETGRTPWLSGSRST